MLLTTIALLLAAPQAADPLETDLPYALGTALAYADDCRAAGFAVGDAQAALASIRRAAPEAVPAVMDAARSASLVRARASLANRLLPEAMRGPADLELARPVCEALASSRYGSVMVRRSAP